MRTQERVVVVLTAALLMGSPIRTPAEQTQAQQAEGIARGELVHVDAAAKTIEIRAWQGAPMLFNYTEEITVTGGQKGVAGLATMAGTHVTVHYIKQRQKNVATQIEVQTKA